MFRIEFRIFEDFSLGRRQPLAEVDQPVAKLGSSLNAAGGWKEREREVLFGIVRRSIEMNWAREY
jgi:hypothetical protein